MINFKTTAQAGAIAVSALLGATVFASSADALTVTLNPSGSVPPLSGNGSFSADSATSSNNATITIFAGGAFSETGFFRVSNFDNGGSPVDNTVIGLNQPGGYSIYGTFTASGVQAGPVGVVTALSFTLWGDPGNNNTYPVSGTTILGTGDDIALGTGLLAEPGVAIVILGADGDPNGLTLNAETTFTVAGGQQGFFVSPNPFNVNIQIGANVADNNATGNCATIPPAAGSCQIDIQSGVIDIAFVAVPEPATLGMLGMGLLGLGAAYRRRRSA